MKTALILTSVILAGLIMPQVMGLVALRAVRRGRLLEKFSTVLIQPVAYFLIAYVYWSVQAHEIRAAGNYVCGVFGAVALFWTLWGIAIHFLIACLVFLALERPWRRQRTPVGLPRASET